mmetsp:Transcript_101778/g.287051  ORF Transcript_101778/g.287051 Transcript_101778/m.287051 type:complete len:393 (-) Transcript_101778:86-1264(-)
MAALSSRCRARRVNSAVQAHAKARQRRPADENARIASELLALALDDLSERLSDRPKVAVLDMRSREDFAKWHVAGSVNVPFGDLANRGFELPPRSTPLLCICDAGGDGSVDACLDCGDTDPLGGATLASTMAFFESRVGGCVIEKWAVLPATNELFHQLASCAGAASGPTVQGRFLFQPSPLLAEELELCKRGNGARGSIAELLDATRAQTGSDASIKALSALDVGCGSGRDTAFLAREGLSVVAVDRDARGLARLAALAERHGLGGLIETRVAKLSSEGDLLAAVATAGGFGGTFDVVHCSRFLHRPTLRELARLLEPGTGLLLYHTFLEGNEHPTGEEHVLRSRELVELFCDTCDVIRDEELPIEDGRRLTFFVARRRPAAVTQVTSPVA